MPYQGHRYGVVLGAASIQASEAVGKFLKYQLLLANLGSPVVSKKRHYSFLFAEKTSTLI